MAKLRSLTCNCFKCIRICICIQFVFACKFVFVFVTFSALDMAALNPQEVGFDAGLMHRLHRRVRCMGQHMQTRQSWENLYLYFCLDLCSYIYSLGQMHGATHANKAEVGKLVCDCICVFVFVFVCTGQSVGVT